MLRIFLSYSRDDISWKNEFLEYTSRLEDENVASIFVDEEMESGTLWLRRIRRALSDMDAAVLLVSGKFLNSEFIRTEELPRIQKAVRNRGIHVLPIFLDDSDCGKQSWFLNHQSYTTPDTSIGALDAKDRAQIYKNIVRDIRNYSLKNTIVRRFFKRNIYNWRFLTKTIVASTASILILGVVAWVLSTPEELLPIVASIPVSQCRSESRGSSVQLFENGWLIAKHEDDKFIAIIKSTDNQVVWHKVDSNGFTKGRPVDCRAIPDEEKLRLGFRWYYCAALATDLRAKLGAPIIHESRGWIQYQQWWSGLLVHGVPSTKPGIESGAFQMLSGMFLDGFASQSGSGRTVSLSDANTTAEIGCYGLWHAARKDRMATPTHLGLRDRCASFVEPAKYSQPAWHCSVLGQK